MRSFVLCPQEPRFGHQFIAILLMGLMLTDAPPVLAAVDSSTNFTSPAKPASTIGPSYPAPVTTPRGIKPNRSIPAVSAPSGHWSFSVNPSDKEIFQHSPFEEPLVPVGGKSTSADNAALAESITAFSKREVRDDFSSLEGFLDSHPNSVWQVSLLTNLGWLYRQTGSYSKALQVWEKAWALGKGETAPQGKAIVDRALSELVVLNARVGRIERLAPLFEEIKGRTIGGSAKEKIEAAKQGYNLMVSHPDRGYRCGPLAVDLLRGLLDKTTPGSLLPFKEPSTTKGTSLTQNYLLAKKMGLDVIMAKRAPGSAILVPSVVNWKVGHFAAIVSQEHGLYHLHDPTFSNDVLISPEALDKEASGYFLIKNQALPSGWTAVSEGEGKSVWGKGPPAITNPTENMSGPTCGDGTCPTGMATSTVYEAMCSLTVADIPLFYKPAYGPAVSFAVSYSQRESAQPSNFTYSNLGPLWTTNWLSYIQDDPTTPGSGITIYNPGGGESTESSYNSTTSSYAPDMESGAVAIITSSSSYEIDHPDGSKMLYSCATTTNPRKIFMTQSVDPQGNALTYTYDSNFRIVAVTDATGLVTTVSYGSSSDIYKITSVTDPFGRTAMLTYTSDGNLASSQDMIGMVSQYYYTNGALTSLQTPYGQTTFDAGQNADERWVQINDPMGGQQRVEVWIITSPDASLSSFSGAHPSNTDIGFLPYRNAFYWGREAMMTGAGDYTKAKITHFAHLSVAGTITNTMSSVVESEQSALEGRIYYNHPGELASYATGSVSLPSRITRILDNGDTQERDFTYNAGFNVTQAKDPSGRTTNFAYGNSNNTDVTQITQKNGSAQDQVFAATYNAYHQPLTKTDSSGQTTQYTYNNTTHQLTSVTNPLSQTVNYSYNGSHQLTSITDATTGGAISYTYDGFGRIQTEQDLNGYVKTYDYDALNRVTKITYPDATFNQFIYANRDVVLHKDRQNRWIRYFYNAQDMLVGIVDPQGRATTYERCMCGALLGLVDAKGNRTKFAYDVESRTVSKTYPDSSQYTYSYETNTSRLKTITDPLSQVATYTYNDDDSISQVTYSNATVATPSVNVSYDTAYPRITSMVDGTGTTTYSYNSVPGSGSTTGANRVATETGPLGSTATISYTYDALGRKTGASINSVGSGVTYDSLSRIMGATNVLGAFTYGYYGTTPRLQSVSNDQNGLNTAYSYQTGSTQDFRLTDISNYSGGTTVLSKFDYTYNPVGTIASWQQQADSNTPTVWNLGYDNADQLTSATQLNTSTSAVLSQDVYGYDPAGNRTSVQNNLNVTQTSYNSLNQITGNSAGGPLQFAGSLSKPAKVTVAGQSATYSNNYSTNFSGMANVTSGTNSVVVVATDVNGNSATNNYQVVVSPGGSTSPTYDSNGNLLSNGNGQAYTWDAKNELVGIVYSSGANSGNHTDFTYDGLGRRVAIVERTGTTLGAGIVASTKKYIWIGSNIAEERDATGTTVTRRFVPQGEQISGSKYYYARDHLGSIRELCDGSGALLSRYSYDLYGQVAITHTAANTATPPVDAEFQYAGYYEHGRSGLNLTLFRAYDSNSGRWLSRDPIGENGGINLYGYVRNNPVWAIDPFGLAPNGVHQGYGPAGSQSGTGALDTDGSGNPAVGETSHGSGTSYEPGGNPLNGDVTPYGAQNPNANGSYTYSPGTTVYVVNNDTGVGVFGVLGDNATPDNNSTGRVEVSSAMAAALGIAQQNSKGRFLNSTKPHSITIYYYPKHHCP